MLGVGSYTAIVLPPPPRAKVVAESLGGRGEVWGLGLGVMKKTTNYAPDNTEGAAFGALSLERRLFRAQIMKGVRSVDTRCCYNVTRHDAGGRHRSSSSTHAGG